MATFRDLLSQGAMPNVVVWHVCGQPWAMTNSVPFADWIAVSATAQNTARRQLFGNAQNTYGDYSAYEIQVLPSLENVSPYSVSYDPDKAINVGGYNVTVSDQTGFVFPYGEFSQSGLPGLDWQPNKKTGGAVWGILGKDLVTDSSDDADFYFLKNADHGLKDYIEGCIAAGDPCYLWVSQTCLETSGKITDEGDNWKSPVKVRQFDAPREDIPGITNKQRAVITNYPQGIAGCSQKLWGLYFEGNAIL